jgi:hypothetical protein
MDDRRFWVAIRRALLMLIAALKEVVTAIEQRWGIPT